jgi:flagellum-specific peptidoglycan hydrolase FlgJ
MLREHGAGRPDGTQGHASIDLAGTVSIPRPRRSTLKRAVAAVVASSLVALASAIAGGPAESASARLLLACAPDQAHLVASAPVYHEPRVVRQAEATAPQPERVTASSRGGVRTTPDISTNEKFIEAMGAAARESQVKTGVPASVTVAQGILESNWGKSLLATKGQNYFGIKALTKPGPAGTISMNTWEVIGGRDVTVRDAFRAYNNIYESVEDHGRFLRENSRYAAAFNHTSSPDEFARAIHRAGYATDPAYTTKLINIMKKYDLYRFDLKQ